MTSRLTQITFALMTALSANASFAMTNTQLQELVEHRLLGDRTGACMAVAVIEKDQVAKVFACADPANRDRIDEKTAFEIGSISKTMTALLLADLIEQGKASLDDPLAKHLPEGTVVPTFNGREILLRHVVTHTSGLPALPSRLGAKNMSDPYAELSEAALLASLEDVTLTREPGMQSEYSNFASMLLSLAVARLAGTDFESHLKARVFDSAGMSSSYINHKPTDVKAAQGHLPSKQATSAWTFSTNLAGVGGVRSTLDDMVRYAQLNLGQIESPLKAAIARVHQPVDLKHSYAMNWLLMPVDERTVLGHEGGTGGFSSFLTIDKERQRGVVILSDTTWNSIGSLGSLGLHLVDSAFPLGSPRIEMDAPAALLKGLEGEYNLAMVGVMRLSQEKGKLVGYVEGQPSFEMNYDNAGDFYPVNFDAILRPSKQPNGLYTFVWMQMGGVIPATRVEESDALSTIPALSEAVLAGYVGDYPLMPNFVLTVRSREGHLFAQATGQGEFRLDARGEDTFEAAAFGIKLVFQRDADKQVKSLVLHQGGQQIPATRQ